MRAHLNYINNIKINNKVAGERQVKLGASYLDKVPVNDTGPVLLCVGW